MIDAGEANQHCGIADVVVRQIVNIGVAGQQFGAIIEIHADDERIGLRRAIGGETCQELSADLERRGAVGRAFFDAGQGKPDVSYCIEIDGAFLH